MKGLILLNAYFTGRDYQAERIKAELEARGVSTDILTNDKFALSVKNGKIKNGLKGYDFCVYLDKDKYLSEMLEKCGVRLFNRHSAIRACDDKMRTHIVLADRGIPMPDTLPGLLCYDINNKLIPSALDKIEKSLGYPVIIKTCYGSLGNGVYMAGNREELEKIAESLKTTPHLFQRCVKTSLGRDIRAIVVGQRVVAAMERKSNSDFRSNLALGGSGRAVSLDGRAAELCVRAANALGLDYCGIDLLDDNGSYVVCEVNSNAFFKGIEGITKINVAGAYAEHILNVMKGVKL